MNFWGECLSSAFIFGMVVAFRAGSRNNWNTLDTLETSKKHKGSKSGTLACPNLHSSITLIPLICDDDDEPRKFSKVIYQCPISFNKN
jgi:hypothetical protein